MADQNDWRNPGNRSRVIQNILNMLKNKNRNFDLSQVTHYETQVFESSNTHDEYKAKLAKLVQHLQTVPPGRAKGGQVAKQQAGGMQTTFSTAQQPQAQQGMQQQAMQQQNMQPGLQQGMQQGMQQLLTQNTQMALHQIQGGTVQQQQQLNVSNTLTSQPLSQPLNSQQMVGGVTSFASDTPFSQSPASSQPQIPSQTGNFTSRPAYSPGPGLPMPSPTQSSMRAPHPSPSMNINVNTPAPAMTPQDPQAPSPASLMTQAPPSTDEEQMYMDKVKELSSYVEPLKKMLTKMAKEGKTNQPDYNKLVVLFNLLQPSNNKTSYDMLCKCEDVLKKLKLPTAKVVKESMHDPNSHWCQPLLTAVAESINSSTTSKNALRQTFGPAMHVLYGPEIGLQQPSITRKRKSSPPPDAEGGKKSASVPHLIQGELARLHRRFKVSRDKTNEDVDGYDDGQGLRLQCALEDKGLPAVPPIRFTLTNDYPLTSPVCPTSMELYETSPFYTEIKTKFLNSLKKLQNKHSMTALLETWLASVKQTCANLEVKEKDMRKLVNV